MRTNPLASVWFLRSALAFALAAVALFAFYTPASAACTMDPIGCAIIDAGAKAFASLLMVLVQVFNFILGWAGMFFNWAMMATVFEFSSYFGNTPGLLLAWNILRDLANIALLFGFVYTGVRMMLDIDKFDVKKTIPMLIIYAALLNFSLFAGEAMIDVSNAVGSTIYAQATSLDCRTAEAAVDCADQGIAGSVLQISGLASVMQGGDAFQKILTAEDSVGAIGLAFALLVFSIVMIGVLVAGALMLVARAITLMILLVVSPIGFAGAVIPGLEKFSKDWWTRLTNNVLFAPVFVLLVLIGLKIAEGVKTSFVGPNASLLDALSEPNLNVGSIFVMFTIVSGFMIAALISAQHFSLVGSKMVVNRALKFIGNTAGGTVLYPAGYVANKAGEEYRKRAGQVRSIMPGWARTAIGLAGGTAIDRSIRGGLKSVSGLKIPGTNMDSYDDMVKVNKDRRAEWDKERRDRESEAGKDKKMGDFKDGMKLALAGNRDSLDTAVSKMSYEQLKETDAVKKGGAALDQLAMSMTNDQFKKLSEDEEIAKSLRDQAFKARHKKINDDVDAAVAQARAGDSDELEKQLRTNSVEKLRATKVFASADAEGLKEAAEIMEAKKFKEFMDDAKVAAPVKREMRKARYEKVKSDLRSGRKSFEKWTSEDVVASGVLDDPTQREEFLVVATDKQFDSVTGAVGTNLSQKLKDARGGTGPGERFSSANASRAIGQMDNWTDVGRLSGKVLTTNHVMDILKPEHLAEISRVNKLDQIERQTISAHVQSIHALPSTNPLKQRLDAYLANLVPRDEVRVRKYYGI